MTISQNIPHTNVTNRLTEWVFPDKLLLIIIAIPHILMVE